MNHIHYSVLIGLQDEFVASRGSMTYISCYVYFMKSISKCNNKYGLELVLSFLIILYLSKKKKKKKRNESKKKRPFFIILNCILKKKERIVKEWKKQQQQKNNLWFFLFKILAW